MKAKITTLMALTLVCRVAMAADTFPAITTTDGKTYDNITDQRTDPDGLYIEYAAPGKGFGSAKIKFTRLSAELQKQYGYDADAAKKYEDDSNKATQAFDSWADQQEAAAQKARADAAARDFQMEATLAQRMPVAAEPTGADSSAYGGGSTGYGGYGYGGVWPYGLPSASARGTGAIYQGTVPLDRLFTPMGFSPNKPQVAPAAPRPGPRFGQQRQF